MGKTFRVKLPGVNLTSDDQDLKNEVKEHLALELLDSYDGRMKAVPEGRQSRPGRLKWGGGEEGGGAAGGGIWRPIKTATEQNRGEGTKALPGRPPGL